LTQLIASCVQHAVAEILGIPECRISQSVAANVDAKSDDTTAIFMVILYLSGIEESGRAGGKGKPLHIWRGEPIPSVFFFGARPVGLGAIIKTVINLLKDSLKFKPIVAFHSWYFILKSVLHDLIASLLRELFLINLTN
jgi:hypothetical protein